jgi:hypothetical protein
LGKRPKISAADADEQNHGQAANKSLFPTDHLCT